MDNILYELNKNSYPKSRSALPSRYTWTPLFTDDEIDRAYLGTWESRNLTEDPSDQLYVLEEYEVGRPDLISYRYYKTPKLYWLILHVNDISDPFEDMYPGMLIRIPALQRVLAARIPIK